MLQGGYLLLLVASFPGPCCCLLDPSPGELPGGNSAHSQGSSLRARALESESGL